MIERPQTTRRAKPTPSQRLALENCVAGRHIAYGVHGRSASGGFSHTILALHRRGWLDKYGEVTQAGKAALS